MKSDVLIKGGVNYQYHNRHILKTTHYVNNTYTRKLIVYLNQTVADYLMTTTNPKPEPTELVCPSCGFSYQKVVFDDMGKIASKSGCRCRKNKTN